MIYTIDVREDTWMAEPRRFRVRVRAADEVDAAAIAACHVSESCLDGAAAWAPIGDGHRVTAIGNQWHWHKFPAWIPRPTGEIIEAREI